MPGENDGIEILRIGLRHISLLEYARQDDLVWRSPLLATLDEPAREDLLGVSSVRKVDQNTQLIEEEERPESLHFLLEGAVVLSTNGGAIDLATLGKGDFFGLASIFNDAVRPAALAAEGGAKVALLPKQRIVYLARAIPDLGKLLAKAAAYRRDRSRECSDFLDMW